MKRGDKEKRGANGGRWWTEKERKEGRTEKLAKGLKNGRNGYMERESERQRQRERERERWWGEFSTEENGAGVVGRTAPWIKA